MFLQMLRRALAAKFDIVDVAGRADELLVLLETSTADCLVLDLQLPDRSDLSLIAEVRQQHPSLPILVLTMFRDRALADAAFAAGAAGFLPKDAGLDTIFRAITEVLAGRRYLSPLLPKTSHRTGIAALHPALQRLTPRQQAVFRLLGAGKTASEIAQAFGVGQSTITFPKTRIRQTLGIENDRALLGYAMLVGGCIEEAGTRTGTADDGRR
jgi:DNA-binding NarL/FixJ family response regulator